jgi:hypothetical protein
MREQIPELVKKCHFLSAKAREQVLENYKTLSEERIEKLIQLLEKGFKKQEEVLQQYRKDKAESKTEHRKEFLKNLKHDEELSRQEEATELAVIEDELNLLF